MGGVVSSEMVERKILMYWSDLPLRSAGGRLLAFLSLMKKEKWSVIK